MDKKLIQLIKQNPVKLANLVGFEDMGAIHNEWIKKMTFGKEDITILGHRGSMKSTALSVSIALTMVLFPNKTIIFLRKTDDDVVEIIKQVSNILQSSVFKYIVNSMYDINLSFKERTSFKIDTILNTSTKGATQLLGVGTSGSLTGKHADIIITDDIVNIKDRVSRAERERIKLVYMELQNIKNRGGRVINTGTPWHADDCIGIMPNIERYDCYTTGLISSEQLQELRKVMSPSLFSANYELKHIADEDALFSNPQFFNDDKLLFNGVCHIDASYGGSDGTAFTIIKQNGDKFYVLGKRRNKHVDDCLSEFYLYMDKYKSGTIYAERNADKGYLHKEMINDNRIVKGYQETMNKYIKISTYLRKNWSNIYFHEDTDSEYLNEILDYTEHSIHDDSPDSLASIIRELTAKGKWLY